MVFPATIPTQSLFEFKLCPYQSGTSHPPVPPSVRYRGVRGAGQDAEAVGEAKDGGAEVDLVGCGQHVAATRIQEICEREVRELPCFEYSTTVVVETYRVKCPRCGFRAEKVTQVPSKAPYSNRFEEAVGQACESAAARQVARRIGLAESTVRAIDLRYLKRWEANRRKPPLRRCRYRLGHDGNRVRQLYLAIVFPTCPMTDS
jgi:hypothetical protein